MFVKCAKPLAFVLLFASCALGADGGRLRHDFRRRIADWRRFLKTRETNIKPRCALRALAR
ncbi:MAG: hypothetical protein LBU11_06565 [Zoogloeaceae bacterium]|jgi:hypothetical protein|nr:hypothetical protein [Zoogloeaceae bacterium]